jgi:hypothetical protein
MLEDNIDNTPLIDAGELDKFIEDISGMPYCTF